MCVVCLGYGAYIALPLIRKAVEDAKPRGGITQQEAVDLLEKCLEVIMGNIKYLLLLLLLVKHSVEMRFVRFRVIPTVFSQLFVVS